MSQKTLSFLRANYLLILIIILGAFFRFYKLDWGEGFFFHPDEYHIVTAVKRLSFPSQMNPNFFSYGSFTIYLIYFTKILFNLQSSPFLIGRLISAFFSSLTIAITYAISQQIFAKKSRKLYSLLTALLVTIAPGVIQQAHFATPESNLTFFLLTTLFLLTKWFQNKKISYYFFSAITLGAAIGIKIVGLVFLPISTVVVALKIMSERNRQKKSKKLTKFISLTLLLIAVSLTTYFLVFPYSILDWQSFRSSMIYETGVGKGDLLVFYTRQFVNTAPIIFQFTKILPFALGLPLLVFGSIGLGIAIYDLVKSFSRKKGNVNYSLLFTALYFFSCFVPNSFLFAKWTRFIAPSFPFWAIFAIHFISKIGQQAKGAVVQKRVVYTSSALLILTTFIWTLMFFSIYQKSDVRVLATTWIEKELPKNSFILTESGNMLEVPLYGKVNKLSFDFYHLDENIKLQQQLPELLEKSDYFIIQSRRIYKNHQRLPNMFPITASFYNQLFSGNLGFEKTKEFTSYPKLWFIEFPDEIAEETWSVFDHPVIRIYKKVKPLTKNDYEKVLKI